ncbi:hypothetical protein, partial [Oceanispirochaeta sp.]|uniref:hypothetical protein n=1 Tax=Oceanispirochaeta sp. TaxID=2035350 RepID=UPI00261CEA7F
MRKIFLFLILLLFISCGEKPDAFFSSDFLLGSVGWAVIPQYEPIAEPVFDGDQSFWTAVKYDKRILNKQNLDGFEEDRISLYLYPAAQEIRNITLSDDGTTALLNIAYDGTSESHIARIVFGSSDHRAFQLDGSQNVMVPNSSSLAITALCYPWPD